MCTLVNSWIKIWINLFTESNDPMTKKSRNFISLNNFHYKGSVYTRSINKTIFQKLIPYLMSIWSWTMIYLQWLPVRFLLHKLPVSVLIFNICLRTSERLAITWFIIVWAINSCFTLEVYCTISSPYTPL